MAQILVTGGAGYIGSHTVVELAQAGYEPVVIDDFSNAEANVPERLEKLLGHPVKVIRGDLKDASLVEKVFAEHDFGGVIHFAAFKAVGESTQKPLAYYENNLVSTIKLLQAMAKAKVEVLVFSSSCTVYGQPDRLPVTEDSPIKPAESTYGNTKQICEEIITDALSSGQALKAVSLRYFNPIGAHPSALIGERPVGIPNNLVPYITQTAKGQRQELTVFGDDYNTPDGTALRDYIHVVDLAKAHVATIDYLEGKSGHFHEPINVGTGQGSTVLQVVQAFERATGVKVNYKVGPRRAGDVEQVYADASASKEKLGWQAELSLEEALRSAWAWEQTLQQ